MSTRVKEIVFAWPPNSSFPNGPSIITEKTTVVSESPVQFAGPIYQLSSVEPELIAADPQIICAGISPTHSSQTIDQHNMSSVSSSPFLMMQTPCLPPQRIQPQQQSSPMSSLSGGGFIFNYPPLYSENPLPPFSRPVQVPVTSVQAPINSTLTSLHPNSPLSSPNNGPLSPHGPLSPLSDMILPGSPLSPISSQLSGISLSSVNTRKEKLEKYRQKRTKRNWNRQVDPTRRERAQARQRDEFGHFLSGPKKSDPEKERMQSEMDEVRNKLEAWMRESLALKNKLSEVENRLEEQEKINTELIHENRILWSTIPQSDVFNTIRPGTPYVDAFKEKIDFANIELNSTDSPFLESLKLDEDPENRWPLDLTNSLSES